jgi:hypothetical protein
VTKLTRTTTHVAINVDGLPRVTRADVEMICEEVAMQVRLFCAAQAECKMLAADSPVIEV